MELKPYKDIVRSIIIQELKDCGWVDLIAIPVLDPEKRSPEEIQKIIEHLHSILYKADQAEFSVQGVNVCIRGLDNSRTFRIMASKFIPLVKYQVQV